MSTYIRALAVALLLCLPALSTATHRVNGASSTESIIANVQVLGSVDVAGLPPAPAVMSMARFTFDPGTRLDGFEVPGPEILVLEAGSLVIDLRGETEDEDDVEGYLDLLIPATPGKDQLSTPIPDVFRYSMLPGDRLLVPADNPHKIETLAKPRLFCWPAQSLHLRRPRRSRHGRQPASRNLFRRGDNCPANERGL